MFFLFDAGRIKSYTLNEFKQARPLQRVQADGSTEMPREGYHVKDGLPNKKQVNNRFSSRYQEVSETTDQEDSDPLMPVERIMSHPVVFLEQTRTMQDAIRVITDSRFRHLPIVDDELKICGIISDRHVLNALMQYNINTYANASVKDYMVKRVITARPKTSVLEIAYIMFMSNIGSMPIADEEGRVLGMVTRSDIGRAFLMISHLDISR